MEVVAQFALVAQEDGVDTGIDVDVAERREVWRASYPLCRIVTPKIGTLAGQQIFALDGNRVAGLEKPHLNDRRFSLRGQAHDDIAGTKERRRIARTIDKVNARICLSPVLFEIERQGWHPGRSEAPTVIVLTEAHGSDAGAYNGSQTHNRV
jgi:hypothetical protein